MENFARMIFPINDQANDQANYNGKTIDVNKLLKLLADLGVKAERKLLYEFKMPTERQVEKYVKLAEQLTEEQIEILRFSSKPRSNKEIQENCLGLKIHTDNFKRYIDPLLNIKVLNKTLANVPNSPLQKYFTTEIGFIALLIIDDK